MHQRIALTLLLLLTPALVSAQPQPAAKASKAPAKAAAKKAKALPQRPTPTVADYVYAKDSERQKFDFWQAKSDKPTPVVLLIHGGGWMNGDKKSYGTTVIQPYLDAGISVAAVNYRFIPQAMEDNVEPAVKGPLHDAARALQTIRSKAKEWNIDPKRIGATGGSAGACTSLYLALADDLADPKSDDPIARESSKLQAAAVSGAQTSLDPKQLREWMPNAIYGGHAFGFHAAGRSRAEEFDLLIANREKVMPWIKQYSPIELITSDDPPIYLDYPNQKTPPVVGQAGPDPTHSALYGIKFAEAAKDSGIEVVVSYPGHKDEKYGSVSKFLIEKLSEPAAAGR